MQKKSSVPNSMPKGKLTKLREKPGMSGAYKHESSKYAGHSNTYPIGDEAHARNALARAHFSSKPAEIKKKVYNAYPGLKKRHEERSKGKK